MSTLPPRLARGVAVILAALALAACDRPAAPAADENALTATAGQERVLRRGNGAEIDSLDPPLAVLAESGNVVRDMYEGLVRIGPDLQPIPGVAERWDVSPDGLQYTFHLRATARWSNGEPVTSDDFVASWRRLVDPKTGSPHASGLEAVLNANAIVAGQAAVESLGVRSPDPRTLVVTLAAPTPFFASSAAHWSLVPTYQGQPPGKAGDVISNGAFVLSRRTVGSDLELRRNARYWNDAATRLEAVRYYQIADNNDEYTRFRAGEIDATLNLPLTTLQEIRSKQGDAVRITPSLAIYYYGFNLKKPPFTSREVRQALAMTVDREKLVRAVTAMGETPAYAWVPTGMPDYTPQVPAWAGLSYDERVARARELYAQAGYSAAKPLRFELRYNTGTGHEKIAIAVAAMWKETLGADVKLVAEEFKSLLQTVQRGDAQVFRSSWSADVPDPYGFVSVFTKDHEFNLTRYANAEFDADLERAAREPDLKVRRALIESAERRVVEDAAVVPLYYMVNRRLIAPRVIDWRDNALRIVYSQDVGVEK